jgi:signal transduction histidine kinase
MRIWPVTLGILFLLVLLTWLLLHGVDANAPAYETTLKAFDDFALAEATLQRDVVQARAGMLRDYDTIVKATEAIDDAVARLRSNAKSERLDAGPLDRLAAMVTQQEELTEQFKSSNALLQNSLSYVGLLSTGTMFGAEESPLAPATGAITAALLNLRRDTSPEAVKALMERIDRFAAQAPSVGPDAEAAQALLGHARLLYRLLPEIDVTLKTLVGLPSPRLLGETRALFAKRHAVVEATVQRSRLLLYLLSMVLLVGLVFLGLQLRMRALALRRRAAFEHVIAQNSTRLINCPPAETEARLHQVLGELGRSIGFERAYVVLAESPGRVHGWCADGASYPAGWPEDALALSARLGTIGSDIVSVPDVDALPPGEVKDAFVAAGVRCWVCVPLIQAGQQRGIMGLDGFDAISAGWDKVFPPPVLRLAGDAVSNAIEREFLERDRTRLTTRLERARRMQMIGSLASGIAHNFNNIIAAILGFSEMVEPQLTPGTKPALHVDEIRRAAERGRDLVDNILTFGRRRDARVRPVPVRTLFEEAASLLRASLPAEIELIIDDVPTGVTVSGEPAQLQQVILNLCTNAAQAMQGSGRIHVTAAEQDLRVSPALSHGELTPSRYVCLAVEDTGNGFDEDVAQRLFEPFFTTRLAGTGLGLATVREIVRDHEGAVNVQSKPGRGSRFEVWLPATRADAVVPVSAVLPLGQGETVLVVENDHERLMRDEEMLAALGYEPVGFQRSADALAAYHATPGRFDIILVSHAPQTQSGLDLARALSEFVPRQPVILATAPTIDIGVDVLAEAGISEVLRRPLSSTELAAALVRWR